MSQQILGILSPLLALIFCLAFFIFWLVQKNRKYILLIAFSYFSFSCGMFISNIGISAESLIHILGTHFCYSIAMITLVWAVSWRIKAPLWILPNLAIAIVATPLIIWLHSNSDLANLRVIAANVVYSTILCAGAYNLWSSRNSSKPEYWLFILFILMAIQSLTRPTAIFWLEGAVTNADYRESIYYSSLNLVMSLLSLLLALTLLAICAYDFLRDIQSQNRTSNAIPNEKVRLDRLRQVMASKIHRNHDLTIKMLAKETGMQTYELRKMINNKLTYKNFREFVNSHRIEEARAMLADPKFLSVSVTEIAFECGFNSIPSFNRVFKTEVGTTPSEYREQYLVERNDVTVN